MIPTQSQSFSMLLVAIAPFLAAFVAPTVKRFLPNHAGWVLALIPTSIFLYLLSFVDLIAQGEKIQFALPWIPNLGIQLSFYLDGLSLVFGLLISGIGAFIVIYSGGYLNGHYHLGRFYAFILMFMGSMLGLVMSDNIITLFVFWELTSITSFLLIGFDHSRQASRRAAIQALVVTGGGGLLLLAGLLLMAFTMRTLDISTMLQQPGFMSEQPTYLLVFILVLFGAATKSAQVPFHFWLPNAMEAPTPVSAYLHSATMVKAGVYLLARMSPILGGTVEWQVTLPILGGITLITGALLALRQTDMKQMLAYTTMASLGMLVMLIGNGSKEGILAAMLFLVAHSFYKGGLFMVVGSIDHETGTRDITQVSGIWKSLPVTFFGAALAAASMAGLPVALGFFAKEEIYLIAKGMEWQHWLLAVTALVGNALMMAAGAAIAIRPFLGVRIATPKTPHEAPLSMLVGPAILAVLGVVVGLFIHQFGDWFFSPSASAIYNHKVSNHLGLHFDPIPLGLSVVTWIVGGIVLWKLDRIRDLLQALARVWTWGPDKGFDQAMFGLVRFADWITRLFHHGRLEQYLILVFVALGVAIYTPMVLNGSLPDVPNVLPQLRFQEWGVLLIAVLGLFAVVFGRTRLVAIVSLGIQGFAVALIFLLLGAPDLGFTQFMVETLSVVILALVMTKLHLDQRDNRVFEEVIRDGGLALICGIGLTTLLLAVLRTDLDTTLTDFFIQTSVPIAHGRNIVNVILVDYRALDTLGEISVVMTAGIAILALIRLRAGGPKRGIGAIKRAAGQRAKRAASKARSAS
ncbi:putative monovalent cation/H+ antiporter subunit A [Maritalea porphyrae]|uniref:putative monovalent cation/H+ antiporter subunit A n=1 Tax=Maritalea porphyrae TaxID=880732 RepID=UPI0022B0758C|nr:putative monovalent cation/H+ antiporter subunit A [Maritalea porphyrae]MCZ4271186.1 putative monovalent cation/H+ antiporter subunit A [Maritalea porphyrae]